MQNIYLNRHLNREKEMEDDFNNFLKEAEETDTLMRAFKYLAIFIMFSIAVLSLTKNPERALNRVINNFKNRNNRQIKNASKPSLKHKEETIQQKQQALAKTELKTAKHWAEKKDDIAIDEEYLKQLDEIISQEEWLHTSTEDANEVQDVATSETDSKEDIKQGIKPRRRATFAKKERTADSPIKAVPTNDRMLIWNTKLPGFNLTKHVSTDPNHIVYPLGSGNRFIFINKYLQLFLESNNGDALDRLVHLCEMGRDQLPNNSKGHSGFIFREEGNTKLLDKSLITKPVNHGDIKNKAQANNTVYVKVKDCVKDYRFFGASVATVNQKKVLFEVNGFRPRHKKQDRITYFPSEASTPKLK